MHSRSSSTVSAPVEPTVTMVKILKRVVPIALLAVARVAFAPANAAQDDFKYPMTIMPYQAKAYVQDREAAEMMSTVSEFPVGLLRWSDTPAAARVGARARNQVGDQPLLHRVVGRHTTEARRERHPAEGAAMVREPAIEAAGALDGRFIVRGAPSGPTLDFIGDAPVEVPFLVANQRAANVTVVLRQAGSAAPVDTIELGADRITGRWVRIVLVRRRANQSR